MHRVALFRVALFVCSLALAAAAGGLAAQSPLHPGARDARTQQLTNARARVACVDDRGEETAAFGHGWRATFGADSVEFVPALGRAAPRAYPLRLQLESILRGKTRALDAATQQVGRAADRKHNQVAFTRGDAVVERYEARPEGLEQTFTFRQRPAGTGDLVVRLRCDTELAPGTGDDGSLCWRAPGRGGVALGKVLGVDADGWQVPGSLRRDGAAVELVLPAALFDQGRYPIVIDPLLGPIVDALPNADCDFPDVAYDAYSQSYCVVWTQFLGGGQTGVVGSVWDASTLGFAYAFMLNQTGNEDSIRVTTINALGVYVLVWCNRSAAGSRVCGIALEPIQGQVTGIALIYGPASVDSPAVGAEATPFDDDCLVIFDDATYGVVGCFFQVEQDFTVTLGPLTVIGGGPAATQPTISKSGGGPGGYLIAWIDRPPGLPGWVRAQVVDNDMVPLGSGAWIQGVPQDARHPTVDGDGFLFMVAWEQLEAGSTTATDILGRTVTIGQTGITSQGPTLGLAVYPGDTDSAPDLAMLASKFGLVYQAHSPNAPLTDDVYFRVLERSGIPCGDELFVDLNTQPGYVYEHAPRIIGRRDGDYLAQADDGLMVFADQEVIRGDSDVGLQAVEAMGPGGPVIDLGGGCGPSGIATTSGEFALGNAAFEFQLYGASPAAVPFLNIGFPGIPLTCGPCALINSVTFQFAANVAGTAHVAMQLPGNPAFVGLVIEFQWVSFSTPWSGCPIVPGLAMSNRVQAQLDY